MNRLIVLFFFSLVLFSCDNENCKETKAEVEEWYKSMLELYKDDPYRLKGINERYALRMAEAC